MKGVQGLIVSYKQEKAVVDMVGWIVALISGALMSIQGVMNTEVTKQTSLWVSTGWVQLSALIVCIAAWLIRQEQCDGFDGCQSEIYASWRCDRCIYHPHGDRQYEPAGSGQSGTADCCFPDSGGVSY